MNNDRQALEYFRGFLARRLGLQFGPEKQDFLGDTLRQGMLETGAARSSDYFQALEAAGPDSPLSRRLVEMLTVGETYFFRQWDHFRALIELAIPARLKARAARRTLRILSAGCASGEEAYSLAMILREHFAETVAWDIQILGIDLNPSSLERARKAVYSSWSLRDTSAVLREAYFEPKGKDFVLRPDIRAMVRFERRNLAEANADLWVPGSWDLILFRNVLMYMTPEAAATVVGRMAAGLAPQACLFLGYAETLRGISNAFHLCHTHESFYYQRLEASPRPQLAVSSQDLASPMAREAEALDPGMSWVEAIQRASERIAGLAARTVPAAALPDALPLPDLERALDLLRRERYAEALEALPTTGAGVDALLLRAVLLLSLGRMEDAEAACRILLGADELNAGAHYLLALCREHAGDLKAAEEEDHTAIYLDADFAMPRLHMGLMARRAGRMDTAKREMAEALALLAREDSSRLLFFGGGFSREGLSELCRSGLRSLEVA